MVNRKVVNSFNTINKIFAMELLFIKKLRNRSIEKKFIRAYRPKLQKSVSYYGFGNYDLKNTA